MNLDFNPPKKASTRSRPPRRPILVILLVVAAAAAAILLSGGESETTLKMPETTAASALSQETPAEPEIRQEFIEGKVQPGETLTALLGTYFTPQELHDLSLRSREIFPLSRICAGQPYRICLTDGAFERFEYDIDREDQFIISRGEEGVDLTRVPIDYEVRTEVIEGEISSSLFEAVAAIGETDSLAIGLADIFAWDIDFILDIRSGDSFRALVEKRFRDGEAAGYGRILAAEFTNQGRDFQAVLFQDGDQSPAYYDADGNSLRKAFLKAPLNFTRISSGFTMRRFHPISKTWKAHPAIDYAAPVGTPIKAVGDGTISQAGYTKYNGNYIKIRHANGFETLYLHMSRFAKKMRKGSQVAQGDVIGYVGSTGLATGPHLCFRMYKNGSPVNPNRVRMKAAPPISRDRLAEFKNAATPLLARLRGDEVQQARVMSPEPGPNR